MKPKISTGYLTPQTKKQQKLINNLSASKKKTQNTNVLEIDDKVFKSLMQCPEKKKMILELLALNQDAIKKYQKDQAKGPDSVKKLKKKVDCESPTALFRRKALEQMSSPQPASKLSSKSSEISVKSSNPVPFDKIFEGVTAFVEIISNGEDRSEGVKSILRSMGAKVKDRISSDVTHVIFKGGSFTTFNKANIIKAHVVSVLWVEFSRKALQRQDERLYHAIKSKPYDSDSSFVCKQIEKEYENLIREEYKRSITEGTPLPSTETLINRRRTLMAPSVSNSGGNLSFCTTNLNLSPVHNINKTAKHHKENNILYTCVDSSDMELTMIDVPIPIDNCTKENHANTSCNTDEMSNKIIKKPYKRRVLDKRKTICSVSTDSDKTSSVILLPNSVFPKKSDAHSKHLTEESIIFGKNGAKKKNQSKSPICKELLKNSSDLEVSTENTGKSSMSLLRISSEDTSDKVEKRQPKKSFDRKTTFMNVKEASTSASHKVLSSTLPNLQVSNENSRNYSVRMSSEYSLDKAHEGASIKSFEKKHGITKTKKSCISSSDTKILSKMSDLQLSTENSKDSSMSSLRISSEHSSSKKENTASVKSSMSPLNISEKSPSRSKYDSFASSGKSSPKLANLVDDVVRALKTPTPEDKGIDESITSDDSEILSPKHCSRKLFPSHEKEIVSSTHKNKKSISSSTSYSGGDSTGKLNKRKRKLYDPDYPIAFKVNDEEEREQRRKEVTIKKAANKEKQCDSNKAVRCDGINTTNTSVVESEDSSPIPNQSQSKVISRRQSVRLLNKKKEAEIRDSSSEEEYKVVKPKISKNVKKKAETKVDFDSSLDEQRNLLEEILSRKTPETLSQKMPRKSRLFKHVKKYRSHSEEECPCPDTLLKRRSTMDFIPTSQRSTAKKVRRTDIIKLPTIVCTKLHTEDVKIFTEAVQQLGRFTVENTVSNNTTHLVAGEPKRTVNMMKAISRGCWVVNYDWVLKSLEKGKWLPEEDFEVLNFAPIVQKSRLQRQAFGSKYSMDVFENCGPIFVGFNTNPKCSDLRDLVALCKGNLVNTKKRARVVVGEGGSDEGLIYVNEMWVLDCIKKNRLICFKNKYLINDKRRESMVV